MLLGVLCLQVRRIAVKLGRAGVHGRLVTKRLGRLGISRVVGLALRLALVGRRSRLAFARPLLARAGLGAHVRMVHNQWVPLTDPVNQLDQLVYA